MKTEADLYPYQNRIEQFIIEHPNCAVWAAMGLGKSVSSLTAILRMMDTLDVNKTLIIGPLRVARKVWTDELKEWAHLQGLRASVMCGSARERLNAMRAEADIYTINVENTQWLCQQFVVREKGRLRQFAKWPWDLVIIDESDGFKSQSSQRWKWMRRVRRLFPRMVQLTGTPVPHSYKDLWAQMFLLDGGERLGKTEQSFKDRWMDPPGFGQMQWTMKPHAEDQIRAQLQDIVISLRSEDYLDLPPIVYNYIRVTLPEAAQEKYDQMERQFITQIVPDKKLTAANGGVLSGKLLQMAGGAVYLNDDEGYEKKWVTLHDEKIKALIELMDTIKGPVLISYTFQHERSRIQEALKGRNVRLLRTKQDEDDWNAGKVDILLLHPKSGGHGLNLQFSGSENIIWFGMTFNRGHYDQLNARLAGGHRRVGKNIVVHHLLAEGTIDVHDALAALDRRGIAQDVLLQIMKERIEKVLNDI